jgi:tRNA (cmo5U34)-methyltransferase
VERYDYVIACNTLHHLLIEEKLSLYKNIITSLKKNGLLLIADYVVSQDEENKIRERYLKLLENGDLKKDKWYHIDLALSEDSERELLDKAGCSEYKLYRNGTNKVEIVARR